MKEKTVLFAFFLIACFLFEPGTAQAYVIVDPYAANNTLIHNPVFDGIFLDELSEQDIVPVIRNNSVEFYLAGNSSNCFLSEGGICTAINCGNAICGSTHLGNKTLGGQTIEQGLVFGSRETHDAIAVENALRYSALSSDEYLSMVEKNIAEMQGGNLDTRYIDERYQSSVDNMINSEILNDKGLDGLDTLLKNGEGDSAIRMLDDYFSRNYEMSAAYDATDIFGAVNNRKIGPAQYSEILSRILSQNGINEDVGAIMNKSDILKNALNAEATNGAFDVLQKNPDLLNEIKKSMDAMNPRLFNELVSKALEESFKNKELMKKLLDTLPDIMSDEKMRDLFLKSSAEAMRKMQETGELGRLLDNIGDIKIREQIIDYAKDSAPSALRSAGDAAKGLMKWDYLLPAVGFILLIIVSMKVRL